MTVQTEINRHDFCKRNERSTKETTQRRAGLPVRKRNGENGLTKSKQEDYRYLNIFETVKAAVTIRQAAEHYGLKVNRNGMACCPFHNDRHPSLKLNEEYFFCFGCGATGDVIEFTAKLFDLGSLQAAQRLAVDFGISTEQGQAVAASRKPKHPHIRQFREDEMFCFRVLTDYLYLLEDWKVHRTKEKGGGAQWRRTGKRLI